MAYPFYDQTIALLAVVAGSFCVWLLALCLILSFWNTVQEGIRHLQRLHQIPCDRCQYFTGEYLLKCTVHPCKALSEAAIECLDFEPIPRSGALAQIKGSCQPPNKSAAIISKVVGANSLDRKADRRRASSPPPLQIPILFRSSSSRPSCNRLN